MKEAMKIFYMAAVAVALTGCASRNPPLYDWGGYDVLLYRSYKEPGTVEATMQKLEAHVVLLETGKQKVAPGMYADLGTMYLQAGNRDKARINFAKERDAWPESKGLMDAMIKTSIKAVATGEAKS
ncbi:MAG: hypothetical protein JWR40_878 [Massilia sp.]|jgi:hypothetical protein|nr:hypothetical protein [Massilia sp.]